MNLSTILEYFTLWRTRTDNPYDVTTTQIGCYTKAEIDTLLSNATRGNGYPILDFKTKQYPQLSGTPRTSLRLQESKIVFYGKEYTLPATTFNLATLFPDGYKSLTFYITVDYNAGVVSYTVLRGPLTSVGESVSSFWIYSFTTDANGNINFDAAGQQAPLLDRKIRFGTFGRLSPSKAGSSVRCIDGNPSQPPTQAALDAWKYN